MHPKYKADVIFSHDSIGTVAINMYQLCGLKADVIFQDQIPSTMPSTSPVAIPQDITARQMEKDT